MPRAEIITIGTELLLGEIVDTNSRYLARTMRDEGVDLFYTATVGDNEERIADAIRESMNRAEIIITTGGLGPTIDDPTRSAIAKAVGVETEFIPELWDQIIDRFRRWGRTPTENNRRQAFIPAGSIPVENPVGTAPCFIVETEKHAIISLPGVPREMEYILHNSILPYLRKRFDLHGLIKARILKLAGIGESKIDSMIEDLEKLVNPTVGLAAHAGQVDVRITAKADTEEDADNLIAEVEAQVRERLGEWIFGADADTLESAAFEYMQSIGKTFVLAEAGLDGKLVRKFAKTGKPFLGGEILTAEKSFAELEIACKKFIEVQEADVCLGAMLVPGEFKADLHVLVITEDTFDHRLHSYGGPPKMAARWAVNVCLNKLRQLK